MKQVKYNPALHHRKSIRLKGHDYGGGGLYFVTLCAHRDSGNLFADEEAREAVEACWREIPAHFPNAEAMNFVVMPDHVHGLIRMGGAKNISPVQGEHGDGLPHGTSRTLGAVVRGFKVGVSKWFARHRPVENVWHRNYYEMIVRSEEAQAKIAEYIRMNPWRCVQTFGNGLRGIGNPSLWNARKLGVLCSRHAPHIGHMPDAPVYFGGWHSPKEREMLEWLLVMNRRVIACPAWGIERAGTVPGFAAALEENRMLILEMRNRDGDLAAAEQRNRFVVQHADDLFVPHVTSGGMLDRILKEC